MPAEAFGPIEKHTAIFERKKAPPSLPRSRFLEYKIGSTKETTKKLRLNHLARAT